MKGRRNHLKNGDKEEVVKGCVSLEGQLLIISFLVSESC